MTTEAKENRIEIKAINTEQKRIIFTLQKNLINRNDCFIRQSEKNDYVRIGEKITPELLSAHLNGEKTIGTYLLNKNNNVKCLCFDVDPEHNQNPLETIKKIKTTILEGKLFRKESLLIEASRYPDPSYHFWVFFEPTIPAKVAKWFGEFVVQKAGITTEIEVFPKQTEIKENGYGNAVKIPFGLHREEKKFSRMLSIDTLEPISNITFCSIQGTTLSEKDTTKILQLTSKPKKVILKETTTTYKEKTKIRPCITEAINSDLSGSTEKHKIRIAIVTELKKSNYTTKEIIDSFRTQTDFNITETTTQVEYILENDYFPFKCATIKELKHCIGENCYLYLKQEKMNREGLINELEKENKFYCHTPDSKNLPVYRWSGIKWEETVLGEILKAKYAIFGKKNPKIGTDNIYEYLQGKGQFTNVKPKPAHLIPFQNGNFNLETEELEETNSEYFILNVLPMDYPKGEEPPTKYHKFQKEIHHPEDIDFINEWFAYNLYTSYSRAMFVILIGNGQNGKSVELDVFQGILGDDNVNNSSIQQLTYSPYGSAEPYQKLAVIADDITSKKISQTGILKSLSSGSKINARRIYGHPFNYTNYAKLTDSCNEPPEIEDDTDAFWIRLKFIEYPNKFVEKPKIGTNEKQAKDKDKLVKELLEEKEQIVKFWISKLVKVYKNGFKFSYNKSTDQVREYYRKKSNPVICWLEEGMIYTEDEADYVLKTDVYPDFKNWCEVNNIKNVPAGRTFFSILQDEAIDAVQIRELNRIRAYRGYKLVTTSQDKSFLTPHNNTNNNNNNKNKNQSITLSCYPVTSSKDKEDSIPENKEETTSFPERDVLSTSSKPVVFFEKLERAGEPCLLCENFASEINAFYPEEPLILIPLCNGEINGCFEKERKKGKYSFEEKNGVI